MKDRLILAAEPAHPDAPSAPRLAETAAFRRLGPDAPSEAVDREVAVEAPISIEVNGIGFAVMMATPAALDDFALGFARAESLIGSMADVSDVTVHRHPLGWIVRLQVGAAANTRVFARARTRVTETACGLCGLENLEALAGPLPVVSRPMTIGPRALRRALDAIRPRQDLGRRTGATHAAALCDAAGRIALLREDVGRHNALDKAIGAAMRAGLDLPAHFALMTSRLSFELVEKAARADLGALVAMSAPTTLALARAAAAGLPVVASARRAGGLAPSPRTPAAPRK